MTFIDPFHRIKTFDDKGYLRANVRNFLELENRPAQFYTAINELQMIREALFAAHEAGLLPQLASGFQFYRMAIDWLRLNNPINQGIAVSQIATYDDINESVAESFLQFIRWFRDNYLNVQPGYSNIQAQIGTLKADKYKSLELDADKYVEEFRQALYEAQQRLAEASDAKIGQLSSDLSQQYNSQIQSISENGSNVINDIKQAQSLTIWHEAYEANIHIYDEKLNGKKWLSIEFKNRLRNVRLKIRKLDLRVSTYVNRRKSFRKFDKHTSKKELLLIWYLFTRSVKLLYILFAHVTIYLFSNLILSLRAQRTIWFTILGVVLVGQSLIFLIFLSNGNLKDLPLGSFIDGSLIGTLASSEYIFAKVSIFIGLILVPSLGYAFTNRNYRIYANLLEQYRHRATVAQTVQGILRYVDESESNKDIRVSLATVAAVAMFEMKNVGHLSKRDGDTLPMAEVLQSIVKK